MTTGTTRYNLMESLEIAPLGTYTNDYDWRFNIKVGDLIDCMDEEMEWLKSTVIRHEFYANGEGESIPLITVGFRTYEAEGNKCDEDDSNKKFYGWTSKCDRSYSVTDPRVQKFGTAHL